MENFFDKTGGIGFKMFGNIHISIIIVTIIAVIILVANRSKLQKFKYKESIRYIAGSILLLNMIIYYTSLIVTGQFDFRLDLPLHLCFITNFFVIYILFTNNKKMYKVIYFFTFIGPLPAMIWTDLASCFDRFIFYQFIISHHIMFLASLYLLLVLNYKVEKKYMIHAFFIGNTYVILMALLNNLIGSNYVMLTTLPENVRQIYPWVNSLPAIVWLELVAILSIMVSYIPAHLLNRKEKIANLNYNI